MIKYITEADIRTYYVLYKCILYHSQFSLQNVKIMLQTHISFHLKIYVIYIQSTIQYSITFLKQNLEKYSIVKYITDSDMSGRILVVHWSCVVVRKLVASLPLLCRAVVLRRKCLLNLILQSMFVLFNIFPNGHFS